jgi:enoyl-CoA hydratase
VPPDLKVFAGGDPEHVLEMLRLGAGLTERMLSFPTPVVVASTGHAVAAGSFLLLAADMRIGVEGPFQIGLNEVKIGLTVPTFAIELARQRLHPAHFDRAVVSATMYGPSDAVVAGFLDRALPAEELRDASHQAATELAALHSQAHVATKLRARAGALERIRAAIASELTIESLIAQAA